MTIPAFNVIIPVYNEAIKLRKTAPILKTALTGLCAHVIYVLNATTDDSSLVIRNVFGHTAHIINLPIASKTGALRAADSVSTHTLRVYLDADIIVEAHTFSALLKPLIDGHADLTSARLIADISQCHGLALRISRVWADQLSRRHDAFMCCTAINETGLQQRGPWPDIFADDDWARNRIHPSRRMIIETAKAYMSPPQDIKNWLKVRVRWIRGSKELKRISTKENYTSVTSVKPKGSLLDLTVYYVIRLAAEPLVYLQKNTHDYWGTDNSTRREKNAK